MNNEFKKIVSKTETRYVLEAASAGATSSGAVATGPAGKKGNLLVQGKDEKPVVQRRNPVAANVNAAVGGGGAGSHKDRRRAEKRGEFKHKKDWRKDVDEKIAEKRERSIINFDANDIKNLEQIRDLETLKTQAFKLISKPSAKPIKPEKVEWFKSKLQMLNNPTSIIKLMYDLLLSGEGHSVIGTKSSTNPNSYRQRFGEEDTTEGWGAGAYDGAVKSSYTGKHNVVPEMDSHYIDQENSMTSSSLGSLYKQAIKLRDLIKKMGDDTTLEPWQQEKIAKASDYVNSVFRSLDDQYDLVSLEEEKQKGVDGKACWTGYKRMGTKKKGGKTVDNCVKVSEDLNEEKNKGLWANIRDRKKKGLPPRKPGEKGAPTKKSWDAAVSASKKKRGVGEETTDASKVFYIYNIPAGQATQAFALGLKRSKNGKWYSLGRRNVRAEFKFGNGKKWSPAVSEKFMPASHFAGTPKNKLGPAAHLKGKMKRPARQGDLVGGGAEESLNELASYGSNKAYQSQGTYKRYNLFVSKKPSTLGSLQGFYIAVAEHPRTLVAVHKAKSKNPEDAVNDIKGLIDKELDQATKVSQNATVDFNVDFVREILPAIDYEPTDFYAKIVDGPRLIIAGLDIIDDSELLKAGGFQKSSIRTVKTSDTAAKLPAIPLSSSSARKANLIANGRYVIKNERKDKYGNFVFDLEFDSVVSAPNEKVKMGEPALTIGTVRSVSSENVKKKTLKKN